MVFRVFPLRSAPIITSNVRYRVPFHLPPEGMFGAKTPRAVCCSDVVSAVRVACAPRLCPGLLVSLSV